MKQPGNINSTVFYLFLTGLLMLLIPLTSKAQLFENNQLFPHTKIIKGKYFDGRRYPFWDHPFWSLDYVDSLGRVVVKESHYKKELRSRHEFEYDSHNNKTLQIHTFDINEPETIDTIRYNYTYSGDRITRQVVTFPSDITRVTELVESVGDSILIYQEKSYYFRPNTGKTDVYGKTYTLTYRNGMLVSNEISETGKTDLSGTVHSLEYTNGLLVNNEVPKNGVEMLRKVTFPYRKNNNSKEIRTYEYYNNGRLKRQTIEMIPEPDQQSSFTGSHESDDQYVEYTFDSKGRIKKSYVVFNGKKFKMVAYKYIK
ncbi:MAG TPA: hypothetical protein VK172_12595 [Lentimicrobium sp.]|nr:hypothetical protein [Lentimicrobium sp.]